MLIHYRGLAARFGLSLAARRAPLGDACHLFIYDRRPDRPSEWRVQGGLRRTIGRRVGCRGSQPPPPDGLTAAPTPAAGVSCISSADGVPRAHPPARAPPPLIDPPGRPRSPGRCHAGLDPPRTEPTSVPARPGSAWRRGGLMSVLTRPGPRSTAGAPGRRPKREKPEDTTAFGEGRRWSGVRWIHEFADSDPFVSK